MQSSNNSDSNIIKIKNLQKNYLKIQRIILDKMKKKMTEINDSSSYDYDQIVKILLEILNKFLNNIKRQIISIHALINLAKLKINRNKKIIEILKTDESTTFNHIINNINFDNSIIIEKIDILNTIYSSELVRLKNVAQIIALIDNFMKNKQMSSHPELYLHKNSNTLLVYLTTYFYELHEFYDEFFEKNKHIKILCKSALTKIMYTINIFIEVFLKKSETSTVKDVIDLFKLTQLKYEQIETIINEGTASIKDATQNLIMSEFTKYRRKRNRK